MVTKTPLLTWEKRSNPSTGNVCLAPALTPTAGTTGMPEIGGAIDYLQREFPLPERCLL
jgi:hypothetical protein